MTSVTTAAIAMRIISTFLVRWWRALCLNRRVAATSTLSIALNDPELNLRDLSVEYDPDYGDLVLHGTFMDGQELTPNSFISYVEQDNTLQIGVSIVNSEDGSEMQLYSCLRRHGEDWTGDEHLVLDPEYADAYKDMTFEEVVAYLGQDPNELP